MHPSRFLSLLEKMRTGDNVSEAVMREKGVYLKIGRISVLNLIQANLEANGYNFDDYEGYMADKTAFVCHISIKRKPEQLDYIRLLQKYFPEAKKILLIRDIRDVIVSVESWKGNLNSLNLLAPHPIGYARFMRYLKNWVTLHERWLIEMKNDPNSLVITFEKMKEDFYTVMKETHNFLNLSVKSDYLNDLYHRFYSIKSKVYVEENRKRGYSFYRSGEVGEWRRRYKWFHFPVMMMFNKKINYILGQV